MKHQALSNKIHAVRDSLLSVLNREFLIFLFFLILSATYWVMSVLSDSMEREIIVPVKIVDVPKNVIIFSDEEMQIRVMVRDKGYTVATYLYADKIKPVNVSFAAYAKSNDRCVVSPSELQKLIAKQLFASTKIISVKPEKLELQYNYGKNKRVPVKLIGSIRPADSYYLASMRFTPDSVTVYSSSSVLDSIAAVYTERQDIRDVKDTLIQEVHLKAIANAKIVPDEAKLTIYPDIMIEATAMVPVQTINVPENKVLRVFPSQVKVQYIIGASQYSRIDMNDFMVVADYDNTDAGTSKHCPIRLIKAPKEVRNPLLVVSQVDYLIEQ